MDIGWEIWLRLMGGRIRAKWLGKAGRASIAFGLQRGRFSAGIYTGLQGESVCWGMGSVCLIRIAADPLHEKRRCLRIYL